MSATQQEEQQSQSSPNKNSVDEKEIKILESWEHSSKDLMEQYKNKFNAFKALADQSGTIEESNLSIGGEYKSEIFKRIDVDGDGKITQQEWTQGWSNLDTQVQQTHHKVNIAKQRMEILEALESKQETPSSLNSSQVNTNQYNTLLDRFKNSSNLSDLTELLNSKSPFKKIENQLDSRKQSNDRPLESLLQQFTTPNRIGEIRVEEKSVTKFGSAQQSASPGFKPSSCLSKVQQQMNLNVETKGNVKTNKRKEELQNFMGKIGLKGNDGYNQQQQLSAEQPNSNIFERMKYCVNNLGLVHNQQKTKGLSDIASDSNFYTGTFKQQLKQYKKDRSDQNERSLKKQFPENPLLQDQSLKNFQLKLLHSQTSGQLSKYARI